jgi:exodeoxyribonuclease X
MARLANRGAGWRLLRRQDSYQLGVLVEELNVAEGLAGDLTPHRATYDVLVTARLFLHLATATDTQPLSPDVLRGEPAGSDDEASTHF